jgi:hypothetical protein
MGMSPQPLPAAWKAEPLPGGHVRLSCAASARRAQGLPGCAALLGVPGLVLGGLLLLAASGASVPVPAPLVYGAWTVVALSVAGILSLPLALLTGREEFVAGPGSLEHRRSGPLGGAPPVIVLRGTQGARLRIATHLSRGNSAHGRSYWVRELHAEPAGAGGRRITIASDTHALSSAASPAETAATFAEDAPARLAAYLAAVTGWPVEDDRAKAERGQ